MCLICRQLEQPSGSPVVGDGPTNADLQQHFEETTPLQHPLAISGEEVQIDYHALLNVCLYIRLVT